MNSGIYLDHAATTPSAPAVVAAMLPYFSEHFGNPSQRSDLGRMALNAVSRARHEISRFLECQPGEVIFTGSGTESNNLALKGIAWQALRRISTPHIITTAIEHPSILRTCEQLETAFGCRITYLPVDAFGGVDPNALRHSIEKNTILISIMQANNEIGTIQPADEIAKIAQEFAIPFHSDSIQAAPWLDVRPSSIGADIVSISGHKLCAPKGIGTIFLREGLELDPLLTGGGQELGLRSGTESVPLIVGLGEAARLLGERLRGAVEEVKSCRDKLINGIMNSIDGVKLTGDAVQRLPNHASFVFSNVDAGVLIDELNANGVYASSGSACGSKRRKPSHVLEALGLTRQWAMGSLRLSIGYETSSEEIETVLKILPRVIQDVRKYTPAS